MILNAITGIETGEIKKVQNELRNSRFNQLIQGVKNLNTKITNGIKTSLFTYKINNLTTNHKLCVTLCPLWFKI